MLNMDLLSFAQITDMYYAEHGVRWIINGSVTKNQENDMCCNAKQQLVLIFWKTA